jgi:ribonuclease G
MDNQILINVTFNETRVAKMENGSVAELYIEREAEPRIVGNIYKGVVGKVVPGMQAAFIDIGLEKSGFISVEDVNEDSLYDVYFESGADEVGSNKDVKGLIQDIMREGQHVLVQVLKESVGGKGAKLSSYIAIPGKYLVLLGTVDIVGISRKIDDQEERDRLSKAVKGMKPEGHGLIARTSSIGASTDELRKDMEALIAQWENIRKKSESAKRPALLYSEPKLYIKTVRDFISAEINKILIDSEHVYREIKDYLKRNFPDFKIKLELYKKKDPIFEHFGVENELKKIFKRQVWLKSGGHIIIDEAEGLTVVDVNTGRYQSGKNQEETIYSLNLEAATEIVKQIRLRNLVGIIVIDFIDIRNPKLRDQIYEAFVEALKKDRSRSVVLEMSAFGVIQMTRQRLRESILSELAEPCPYCEGVGLLKSHHTVSYEIIREIKKQIDKSRSNNNKGNKIIVRANSSVIKTLKLSENDNIDRMQDEYGVEIDFKGGSGRIEKFQVTVE